MGNGTNIPITLTHMKYSIVHTHGATCSGRSPDKIFSQSQDMSFSSLIDSVIWPTSSEAEPFTGPTVHGYILSPSPALSLWSESAVVAVRLTELSTAFAKDLQIF